MASIEHTGGAAAWLDGRTPRKTFRKKINWKKFPVLAALAGTLAVIGVRVIAPHKTSLASLFHMPFTVAGFGCAAYSAFHYCSGFGWLATGVLLVVLELMIADEA